MWEDLESEIHELFEGDSEYRTMIALEKRVNYSIDLKREWHRAYNRLPHVRAAKRLWSQDPINKERRKLWMKEYNQRPEIKSRRQARMKIYQSRPDVKARRKAWKKNKQREDRELIRAIRLAYKLNDNR